MITVGRPRRALDVLFEGVERDNEFPGLVHEEGTPGGHGVDVVFMKLGAFLKKDPDIVAERALKVDWATRISEAMKPVKLWPTLPLLAGLKN